MRRVTFILSLLCVGAFAVVLQGKDRVAKRDIVSQKAIGEFACGPCAFVNCLSWGSPSLRASVKKIKGATLEDKVKKLIELYGSKPSEGYAKKRPRYEETSGLTWVDMVYFGNDFLRAKGFSWRLKGQYLDRGEKETLSVHLRRVHQRYQKSIKKGVPVVTSIRSFGPYYDEEKKAHFWKGLAGHWVTVVKVQETIADNEKSFWFQYVDPFTGKLEHGTIYFDEARNFTVIKGDSKNYKWVGNRAFLCINAPSLRLYTQDQSWYFRTVITLNYAVYRD